MRPALIPTAAAILVALGTGSVRGGAVTDDLREILAVTPPHEPVPVLVYVHEQVDLDALGAQLRAERVTRHDRHAAVVETLRLTARVGQSDLTAHLADLERQGRVRDVEAFWIVSALRLVATAPEIERIAARDDVNLVYPDYGIELIEPIDGVAPDEADEADDHGRTPRPPEPGLVAVRAPEVWALGITGAGVLVATLDSGVDGHHPALASRWAGVADPRYAEHPEWAWFDPFTETRFPNAFGSHGTHTMGSVCGGAPGDEVGVAPGAHWIHAAVVGRAGTRRTIVEVIRAFEWMLDPDGDPGTIFDVPRVCSNSWGVPPSQQFPPCDETFWAFLDACEEAGIVMIFSAGNEGSSGLRQPADRATDDYRTMAVAAVNANEPGWPISGFSSRGPTFCTPVGDPAIKPDIAAPGEDVRSSIPDGGYRESSGTSMASPHVNGVVALMLEARPDLSVVETKQIIYQTAFDLGSSGEDNRYGWGMVDAYEAVQAALALRYDCLGDVDENGEVEVEDVLALLASWGPCAECPADLDESGVVDDADLLILRAAWGPCETLGACCLPAVGECIRAPASGCAAVGGVFQGDGSVCVDGECDYDHCTGAIAVGEGAFPYTTFETTDAGPALPPECDEGRGLLFRRDVWFRYTAACDGVASVSVCDSTFDTRLAVYAADAPECPGAFIACNDDACGDGGTRSALFFPVAAGEQYLVRIGARFAIGEGTLVIECAE